MLMTNKHIVCAQCGAVNRIAASKLLEAPRCGKCKLALFNGKPIDLTQQNFTQFIQRTDIPVVVDFWASWCGPCKMMAPELVKTAETLEPNFRIAKLNTEQAQQLSAQYNIRSIPCLILFKAGKEVDRKTGFMRSSELMQWLSQYR
jgi:thioredoxin 2